MASGIGVQKSHLIQNDRRPKEAVGRNCLQICEICHRKERLNLFCVASRATADPEEEAVERQVCVFYQECLWRCEVPVPGSI